MIPKLTRRGLRGVKRVVCDAHEGIKAAVSKVLSATWQCCRVAEAQVLIEAWRRHFNAVRPHSALKYHPPAPEAVLPRSGNIVP